MEQSVIENEKTLVDMMDEDAEKPVMDDVSEFDEGGVDVIGFHVGETESVESVVGESSNLDVGVESKDIGKVDETDIHVDEVSEELFDEAADIDSDSDVESLSVDGSVAVSKIGNNDQIIVRDDHDDEVNNLRSDLDELSQRVDEGFSVNEGQIFDIVDGVGTKAGLKEFLKLKRDFNILSKRLHRVAKEADVTRAEVLDATKIPAEVLEITYRKTLNDLNSAIIDDFGDRDAVEIVERVVDDVRKTSAGVDLLSFEDGKFTVKKLAEAIYAKLISPKQIHSTYVEFFRQLSECVPGYEARDFKSFVETGSREYAVEEISAHAKRFTTLEMDMSSIKNEMSEISEHFASIEKVGGERSDEIKDNLDKLANVSEKMDAMVNAINLHTRFIKKLNGNIGGTQSILESYKSEISGTFDVFSSHVEDTFENKADRSEIQDVIVNLSSLKDEAESSIEKLSSDLYGGFDTKADVDMIKTLIEDVVAFRGEFSKLQEEVVLLRSINKLPTIERVVCSTLDDLGKTTMKKLEDKILSDGTEIHGDKLFAVIDKLKKSGYITSMKKGRYTYYSLNRYDSLN